MAAAGKVTSVDTSSATGSCGAATAKTGTFVVENEKTTKTITVTVTTATKFIESKTTGVDFTDVCVGKTVLVEGTVTAGAFDASTVVIELPPVHHVTAAGEVTSVTATGKSATCGNATKMGSFVVENEKTTKTITATVTTATKFTEFKTTGVDFSDVCVGKTVLVDGTVTAGTFDATLVFVGVPDTFLPQPQH